MSLNYSSKKGISNTNQNRFMPGIKNWHLTIKCTLLSSQGPDTPRTDQTNGPPKSSPTTKTKGSGETANQINQASSAARLRCGDKGIHYAQPRVNANPNRNTGVSERTPLILSNSQPLETRPSPPKHPLTCARKTHFRRKHPISSAATSIRARPHASVHER